MPAMHLISVDLPAPLSPTSAITSPARTSKSTSLSAWTEPKLLEMPRNSSVGAEVAVAAFMKGAERVGTGTPHERPRTGRSYLQYFAYSPLQTSFFFK